MIDIKVDLSQLGELTDQFEHTDFKPAISRALNRTGDTVTTAVGRQLAAETGLGVRAVREDVDQQRSSPQDLTYTIAISGGYQPLSHFQPRQVRAGISARPWAHRRTFPHTFFGPNDEVFVREGSARLPIRKLFGPNLAVEAERGMTEQVARQAAAEAMPVRLAHEVARALPGRKGGGDGD